VGLRISALLVIALAARGAAAQPGAQDKARAQTAFAEGQQRYAAGEYVAAGERFEAAHVLDADPAYLFNAAQAYRLGHACAKAAALYRAFLRDVPDPPNKLKVQQYLEQSDACAKTEPAATPRPPVVAEPVRPTPAVVSASDPGPRNRRIAIATMIGGGVALGVGLYFTHRVGVYENEREALCAGATATLPCNWEAVRADAARLEDSGHRAEVGSFVAYGIGTAALVAGAAIYVLSGNTEAAPAVTITPTVNGAFAVGSFSF
jgi:hypothetical protein